MNASERTREAPRRSRSTIVAALVVVSAALVSYQSLAAPSSSATSPRAAERLARAPHHGVRARLPPFARNGRLRGLVGQSEEAGPAGRYLSNAVSPAAANRPPALPGPPR